MNPSNKNKNNQLLPHQLSVLKKKEDKIQNRIMHATVIMIMMKVIMMIMMTMTVTTTTTTKLKKLWRNNGN